MTDDPGRTPDDEVDAEPGLVVEGDELDLDDEPEAEPEPEDTEPEDTEPEPEPEPEDTDVPDDSERPVHEPPEGAFADDEDEVELDHDDADLPDDESPADDAGDDSTEVVVPATAADDDGPTRHVGRRILLGLVAIVGLLYVAGWFVTGTRMPADATVGDVDVSGLSPSAARSAVERATADELDQKIVLRKGGKEFETTPEDAGLALDVDRSVAQAGGERSWKPADIVALFAGQQEHDFALDVDDAKLQGFVATIAEAVDKDVVEAQITFPQGKPVAREPKAGRVVAKADAATAIRRAYLVADEPVAVPTAYVEPAVDADGLADAMKTIAKPAVSGPVAIAVGDKKISLPVTAYAPALVIRVEDGRLRPHLDAKRLAKPLTDSTTGFGKKAVDATVRIKDGKPRVVPGKEGVGLQPREMARKLVPVLTETGSERAVEVRAKVVEPLFTTADAKALRIKERISQFVTEYPYAEYRNVNQGRAAEIINGTIIKPGETFSFNDIVGERTEANGFVTGTVINGGVFREELGGGVSQVATTTYNAGFFGGMDDVEHHPHAFYINRYPVGREATVYYGSLDLRWKNPTKYGVLVRAYVDKSTPSKAGRTHVELWSTKVWTIKAGQSERRNGRSPGTQYDDTDRCVPQDPIAGFDIDIYRYFYKGGKKVKTEKDTANYQAADHVICGKKPKN